MNILGPEDLVFGVDNVEACRTYFRDYGLREIALDDGGHRFEAVDGTAVTIRASDDPALPPPLPTATTLRQTVWGCADQATVDAIAADLSRDREVVRRADGSIATTDDVGFQLAFRVTTRRALALAPEKVNSPGAAPGRAVNEIGGDEDGDALPLTLSHVVLFVPDTARAEAFYIDRLKFLVTDRLGPDGPFLRPQANDDHHCLFLIQTPPAMQGIEHVAFHVQGPTALMTAGTRFVNKGYESFWGPGRHKFGSNWFWYFNSPMGCHVEYDADMDKHDDSWEPRFAEPGADSSQMWLFESVGKFFPRRRPAQPLTGEEPSPEMPLCRLDELADGASRGFDPLDEGRDTMFVVRCGSQVFGYRNACPHHDFARMAWKKDEYLNPDGTLIRCSAHGALFRIADGICEAGPCVGERLTPVALTVRAGLLWLAGPYLPGRYLTVSRATRKA